MARKELQPEQLAWHTSAKEYLQRLAAAEHKAQQASHEKRRKRGTVKYSPSEYHSKLVKLLDDNNENDFKALKLLEGYTSAIGF